MKKWLIVLGMITCIFGMSACGQEAEAETAEQKEIVETLENRGGQMVEAIAILCSDEQFAAEKEQAVKEDPVFASAVGSWESALADMGSYVDILEKNAELNDDGAIITVKVDGTDHDANVEIILDKNYMATNIATNVIYSFGELMEKAALNTLLGMGTVFVVLILICLLISCFTFIPKVQAAFTKKAKVEEKPAAVDHTIAQIIEKEELTDDLELVAVIAAAIAASEGAASTDGFIVRSIRKKRMF